MIISIGGLRGVGDRETDADRRTHQTGRAKGPIMQQPTGGDGPRGTIRIINTLVVSGAIVPPAVHRERSISSVEGPRPEHQGGGTNPTLIWAKFADCLVSE